MTIVLDGSSGITAPGGTAAAPSITTTGDVNTGIFFPAADTIAFSEGGVEAARFDSSGNLGLGVTPSAWESSAAIQIANNYSYSKYGVGRNYYYDGANNRYITTNAAGSYQISGGGAHVWSTAASGTAGNTVTFTQAMTLDASSRLAVGNTVASSMDAGADNLVIGSGSGTEGMTIYSGSSNSGTIYFADGSSGDDRFRGQIVYSHSSNSLNFITNAAASAQLILDSSGNLGIGTTTPSTFGKLAILSTGTSTTVALVNSSSSSASNTVSTDYFLPNSFGGLEKSATIGAINPNAGGNNGGVLYFSTSSNGTATTPTERARITSGGLVLLNTSSAFFGTRILQVNGGSGPAAAFTCSTAGNDCLDIWNSATSGNNVFVEFQTDGGSARGTISYNRAGGLTAYNTTSDYRAKDILGPVQNSGATIDALKVYEGQMKGATQSRPMLVAHEAQEHAPYAVTGEKDAVNEDGTPKYQQMDVSALVPLLLAELQSVRARLAALEGNN